MFAAPYLVYVESTTGLVAHVTSGLAYSRQEAERIEVAVRIAREPNAEVNVGFAHLRISARTDSADDLALRLQAFMAPRDGLGQRLGRGCHQIRRKHDRRQIIALGQQARHHLLQGLVVDADDSDAKARSETELVRQRPRVSDPLGPSRGTVAEVELERATGPGETKDPIHGGKMPHLPERDPGPEAAAEHELLTLEERFDLGRLGGEASRAAGLLSDRRTLCGGHVVGSRADGSRGPDVRLAVPTSDAGRPRLASVVLAHEIEVAVRRSHVTRRGAVAATVLEAVVPLTTLHTSGVFGRGAAFPQPPPE